MATLSIILAWTIPWTEEPGGLQSTGLQKSWTGVLQTKSQLPSSLGKLPVQGFQLSTHNHQPGPGKVCGD